MSDLATINSTLVNIRKNTDLSLQYQRAAVKRDQDNTKKIVEANTEKQSLRDKATSFMKGSGKDPADVKQVKSAGADANKKPNEASLGAFGKIMGLATIGLLFKDEIFNFFKGLLQTVYEYVERWWENDFKPAAQRLYEALVPKALRDAITGISDWFTKQYNNLVNSSFWKYLFGDEDTGKEGILSGPVKAVSEWFGNAKTALGQFGKDIGIFNEDGSFTLGGALAGGTAIAAITTIFGVKGLFSLMLAPLKLALKGIGLLAKAPFKLISGTLGLLGKGLTAAAAATGVSKTAQAAAGAAAAAKVTGVRPGDVVTSKAGNKVLAGVDGKPTAIKPGDVKGKADILKAADKAGVKGQVVSPAQGAEPPKAGNTKADKTAALTKKFPKVFKVLNFLRGVPGLGTALAVGPLIALMATGAGPKQIAPVLGGILGSALGFKGGALLGGLLGAAGGPLAIATGIGGGVLGALAGDRLGSSLAQATLGLEANSMPYGFGWVDNLINKGFGTGKSSSGSSPQSVPLTDADYGSDGDDTQAPPPITTSPPTSTNAKLSSISKQGAEQMAAVSSGGTNVTNIDNSVNNSNNTTGGGGGGTTRSVGSPSQYAKDFSRKYAYGVA